MCLFSDIINYNLLTFALLVVMVVVVGGLGGHFDRTICFFANSGKPEALLATVLGYLSTHIFVPFLKISAQCHLRSGHQSGQLAPF